MLLLLVANRNNAVRVSLLDRWEREELLKIRKQEGFYCPACAEQVIPKLGSKRIWHFSHQSDAKCLAGGEPETNDHLLGKKLLYEWLLRQQINASLEHYIASIKQRPDILIEHAGRQYAIEFQCSLIDEQLFLKRTNQYRKLSITPIWILGGNRLKRLTEDKFHISPFEWLFARKRSDSQPFIPYFHTGTKQFVVLHHVTPFSPSISFAKLQVTQLSELSFDDFINPANQRTYIFEHWNDEKVKWRMSQAHFRNSSTDFFKNEIYRSGYILSQLPAEAGVPVHSGAWLKSPAILWQGVILFRYVLARKVGDSITFHEVYHDVKKMISTGQLQQRTLPFYENSHYSFAVMDYLQALTKLGVLVRTGNTSFKIKKQVVVPTSIIEVMDGDQKIFRQVHQ